LLPEKIQRLEAEHLALQAAISDPKLFQRSKDEGALAIQRLKALASELQTAYSRWDALETAANP
jgi:hypothetical protein